MICLAVASFYGGAQTSGGSIVMARSADADFLDPGFSNIVENQDVAGSIFDGLVAFGEDGNIIPALATQWEISEDGLTYTFHLREGVEFHDGTAFNAASVLASFNRHFEDSPSRMYPERPSSILLFTAGTLSYGGVSAPDDMTVVFTLSSPFADFLTTLAGSQAAIVSPTALQQHGEDFAIHPIGTGPFMLSEWIKDDRVVLVRNPDYWDGAPYVDEVVFKVVPDTSARLLELKTGAANVIKDLLPDQIAAVESDSNLALLRKPSLSFGAMVINLTKPPLDNILVRKAIQYAIDRDAIVEQIMGAVAERTNSPLAGFPCYHDCIAVYEYDPALARAYLAAAGYPDGFETELWTFSFARYYMPNAVDVAEKIQYDLAQVGITANLTVFDTGTYWSKVNNLEGHLLMAGWGANPSMDMKMRVATLEESKNDFGNTPVGQVLGEMARQAQVTADPDARCHIYRRMQEIVNDEATAVIINNAQYVWGTTADLHNVIITINGRPDFSRAWIQ
jgi:peptide/nickel transport system substrate-binding protein